MLFSVAQGFTLGMNGWSFQKPINGLQIAPTLSDPGVNAWARENVTMKSGHYPSSFLKDTIMSNKLLIAFVVLLTLSSSTIAQQRAAGSLSGQVTDELGALVVGATVTLISPEGSEKTTVTNDEGNYLFNSLASGRYTVKVISAGFSNYAKQRSRGQDGHS